MTCSATRWGGPHTLMSALLCRGDPHILVLQGGGTPIPLCYKMGEPLLPCVCRSRCRHTSTTHRTPLLCRTPRSWSRSLPPRSWSRSQKFQVQALSSGPDTDTAGLDTELQVQTLELEVQTHGSGVGHVTAPPCCGCYCHECRTRYLILGHGLRRVTATPLL